MSARIIFYGGAKELGGTQLLLEDGGTRVLVDFGLNFDRWGKHYGFPYAPRKYHALTELTRLGLYPGFDAHPGFDGVYRPDYLRHAGRTPTERSVDAMVLSHAHLDHAAGIHFLRLDIPVHMDRHTKRILHSMQSTGGASYNNFIDFTYTYGQTPRLREDGNRWLQGDAVTVSRPVITIRPPEPFKVGNITFEPFYIDHSMPGACAFIINTSAGTVVYTGDIRIRGRRRQDTEKFVREAAKRRPDYLLCEGSLIWKRHRGDEESLVDYISDFIKDRKGLVVISYPPRDLDRVATLYKVARRTGRKLVVSTKQAHLLDLFDGEFGYPRTNHKYIGIYTPRKSSGTEQEGDYFMWERKYLEHANRVTVDELSKNQGGFILCLSSSNVSDLVDIDPGKDSVYVRSHPEPYTEEMDLDEKILGEWLTRFNLLHEEDQRDLFEIGSPNPMPEPYAIPQVHVTGHMSFDETAEFVNAINPRTLVPIHTINPELFPEMGFKGRIWTPDLGSVLEL